MSAKRQTTEPKKAAGTALREWKSLKKTTSQTIKAKQLTAGDWFRVKDEMGRPDIHRNPFYMANNKHLRVVALKENCTQKIAIIAERGLTLTTGILMWNESLIVKRCVKGPAIYTEESDTEDTSDEEQEEGPEEGVECVNCGQG